VWSVMCDLEEIIMKGKIGLKYVVGADLLLFFCKVTPDLW